MVNKHVGTEFKMVTFLLCSSAVRNVIYKHLFIVLVYLSLPLDQVSLEDQDRLEDPRPLKNIFRSNIFRHSIKFEPVN